MIHLKVLQPLRSKIDEECESVIVPGIDGDFQVFEGHTPFITKIRPGTLYVMNKSDEQKYAIHDGFVTVENDEIIILSEVMEGSDSIDSTRAEEAKTRAEQRLKEKVEGTDFRRAEAALKRAIARIETIE